MIRYLFTGVSNMNKEKQSDIVYYEEILSVSFSLGVFDHEYIDIKIEKSDVGAKVCFLQPYGEFPFTELSEEEWKDLMDKLFNIYGVQEWKNDYIKSDSGSGQHWRLHMSLKNGFEKTCEGYFPYRPDSWDYKDSFRYLYKCRAESLPETNLQN